MTHDEIKILLNDYFDENLSLEVNTEIQVHLSECNECSQYLFSLQDLMKKVDQLPRNIKPQSDFWKDIFDSLSNIKAENIKQKEELDELEAEKQVEESEEEKAKRKELEKAQKLLEWERRKAILLEKLKRPAYKYSLIGLGGLLVLSFVYNLFFSRGNAWEVKKLQFIGNHSEAFGELTEDEILETNAISRLQVDIPDVGSVFIEPGTRIQRLKSGHIQLLQGSILTDKNGAKKFLTINVPGGEIADYFLGGQSRISLNNPTTTILEVIDGWVSVQQGDQEALVLPKHICKIDADSGIGLPYLDDSSKEFVNAVNEYCFKNRDNEEVLVSVLTKADVSNSVTLWNLLKRVPRKQRDMVINTIFGLLGEFPKGVTEDGLKTLDNAMLQKLIEEIEIKI